LERATLSITLKRTSLSYPAETCLFSGLEQCSFLQVRDTTSTININNQEKNDFFLDNVDVFFSVFSLLRLLTMNDLH
jgi:hypothetical protein